MVIERMCTQVYFTSSKSTIVPRHGDLHLLPFLMANFGRWGRPITVCTVDSKISYYPTCGQTSKSTESSIINQTTQLLHNTDFLSHVYCKVSSRSPFGPVGPKCFLQRTLSCAVSVTLSRHTHPSFRPVPFVIPVLHNHSVRQCKRLCQGRRVRFTSIRKSDFWTSCNSRIWTISVHCCQPDASQGVRTTITFWFVHEMVISRNFIQNNSQDAYAILLLEYCAATSQHFVLWRDRCLHRVSSSSACISNERSP